MDFLEKDLEEIIFKSSKDDLSKKGLYISGKLYKQLRIGNYGVADLIEVTRVPYGSYGHKSCPMLMITVYELKKDKIGISAFLQALGYIKGIHRYLSMRKFPFDIDLNIVLIGKRIDEASTFAYLPDIIPTTDFMANNFLSCYTYSYDIDGLNFKTECGYNLITEGF